MRGFLFFGGFLKLPYLCVLKLYFMFDKLLEFITNLGHEILPFTIVNQWEQGVYLRVGKFRKIVKPGIEFKIPFFDKIWVHEVITQTIQLHPQTLTTADEKGVVLKSIIRYHINDVQKFLLNVIHASDVLVDTTQGVIRDIVEVTEWNDLVDVNEIITNKVSELVTDWGITIEKITLTDLGIVKTYRIMSDTKEVTNLVG